METIAAMTNVPHLARAPGIVTGRLRPIESRNPEAGESSLFRAANRVADALGLFRRPLSARELMRLAQRQAGLTEFGERGFEAALEVLLRSFEDEADLSAFGRLVARWDTLRFLRNLLELQEAERVTPAISAEPIDRPIFISGMPRSGTTFLHNMLAQDEANAVVHCWETIYPATRNPERRRNAVARQLAGFARVAPKLAAVHDLSADSPQECTEITAHLFASYRFDTTHHVPSYREWIDGAGLSSAYRFHKRFLRHLQHRNGRRRWILKCPDHVFALAAIREVYPDAYFVFLHRDPVRVISSVAQLTEILRRPFTRSVDRFQIGRQVSERWEEGAHILVRANDDRSAASDRVCHLKFESLVRDPLRSISALYERMGLTLNRAGEARIRAEIFSKNASAREHGKVQLEDYGLDAETIRERYRQYISCFEL
jgi:Sulfotransferase family